MDVKSAHILTEKDRTEDIEIQENVSFTDMHLSDSVLRGLHAAGFVRPSPIQLQALPLGNCGLDLIIQAKSGTGKTIVFTVIALEMISVIAKTTQVLVVAPTREIAVQISQVVNTIGSALVDLRASTFIGGIDLNQDKAKLKCCHIAIGTPGRLNQLVSLGVLNLNNVRLLVLDEADQLLTGQFKDAILQLVTTLPLSKQVLALSATYPNEVTNFLDKFMRKPTHVRLGRESPALIGVNQLVRLVPNHPQPHQRHKIKMCELISLLSSTSFNQCLVFSNSQLRAESVCNQLLSQGWPASYLTGGQPQKERLQAFQDLCTYRCRILVSTDLSARGLDSEHVNFVINLDIPHEQATYMHRIGRAGRFGSKGGAVSIACEGEEWEAMKAIATLANVNVYIMTENWNSGINLPDNAEELQHLSESDCNVWLKMQNKEKMNLRKKCNGITASNKCNKIENEKELGYKTRIKQCNGVEKADFSKENNESNYSSCSTNCTEKNSDYNELPSCHSNQDKDNKKNGRHNNGFIREDHDSAISKLKEYDQSDIKQLFSQLFHCEKNIAFTHDKIYNECHESWDSVTNFDASSSPCNSGIVFKNNEVINEMLIQRHLNYVEEKLAKSVEESSSFKLTDIKLSLQNVIDGVNELSLNKNCIPLVNCSTYNAELSSNGNINNNHSILPCSSILPKCTSDTKIEPCRLIFNGNIDTSFRKKCKDSPLTPEIKNSIPIVNVPNTSCENVNTVSTSLNSDFHNTSHNVVLNSSYLLDSIADAKEETGLKNKYNDPVGNSDKKRCKDANYYANTAFGMWQTLNQSSLSKNEIFSSSEKQTKYKSSHKNKPKPEKEAICQNYYYDKDSCGISNIDSPLCNKVSRKGHKRQATKLPRSSMHNNKIYSYNDTDDTLKFYINSAAKFTSMVEYCRHLGKMSCQLAKLNNDSLMESHFKSFP